MEQPESIRSTYLSQGILFSSRSCSLPSTASSVDRAMLVAHFSQSWRPACSRYYHRTLSFFSRILLQLPPPRYKAFSTLVSQGHNSTPARPVRQECISDRSVKRPAGLLPSIIRYRLPHFDSMLSRLCQWTYSIEAEVPTQSRVFPSARRRRFNRMHPIHFDSGQREQVGVAY